MSDQIPFHIQEEIMTRLPVKSIIRFRCVSKEWKSLIDSSHFIAAHSLLSHTQSQHLLVSCQEDEAEGKYVCYIDDDTFPHQRSLPTLPPPLSTNELIYPDVVGSSRGLVCFSGYTSLIYKALLWNPSIRKSIIVDVPNEYDDVVFGVCPVTNDPKILSITLETSYISEVMVYTLSSGKWGSLSANLPTKHILGLVWPVVTDQFIYWLTVLETHGVILAFDVIRENFEAINFPDSLARRGHEGLDIVKLRESLAIFQYKENHICEVWMMEHGVKRSFTKLFNIITPSPKDYIVGFRKNGIPILVVTDGDPDDDPDDADDDGDDHKPVKLVVYEPTSDHDGILEMTPHHFKVISYMETLILLGRSDYISD